MGYFKPGPMGTEVRDVPCAIIGGKGLYIFRQRGGFHELVGSCFILGFMDGDTVEGVECRDLEVQATRIR